jgi:hypothetical protein
VAAQANLAIVHFRFLAAMVVLGAEQVLALAADCRQPKQAYLVKDFLAAIQATRAAVAVAEEQEPQVIPEPYMAAMAAQVFT